MKSIIQKLELMVVVLLSFLPMYAYDFEVDGIAYTITSFSELYCAVSSSDATYEGDIIIPSEVTFNGRSLTVSSISGGAFKNSQVYSVQLPKTLLEIESEAFADCANLNSCILNEGLQSIGDNAFNGCTGLLHIEFPASLKTIGEACFANCKSLPEINFGVNMTEVGKSCFMNCENIRKISLSNNLSQIKERTFYGCQNLCEVLWGNSLLEIQGYAFSHCGFTEFVIPNTVSKIGSSILSNNDNLKSFTIGNNIEIISSNPIEGCSNIKDLVIADGGTPLILDFSSGSYSKVETDRATSSNEYWKSKSYYTTPGAFSASTFESVYIGRPLSNPSYTDESGDRGGENYDYYYTLPPFYGNKNIKSVTIGSNVSSLYGVGFSCKHTSFYYGWLEGCSNIEVLTISGLSNIPKFFAKDAISLKTIELPNTTHSVGDNAFYNCASLESISFGSKLSSIGNNALGNCENLKSIYCKSNRPPTYSTGFSKEIYLYCNLFIPLNTEQSYKYKTPWDNFWNIQESQKCVSEFEHDGLLYSVTAENNVIVSGNVITEPRDLVIPTQVEYNSSSYNVVGIGENAFKGSLNILSVIIPGSISVISNDAFSECNNLKTMTIEYDNKSLMLGHMSNLQLSNSITPFPNATTVDEANTGFRNGYYYGLFYGLPIERLIINRDIELLKYYERTVGSSTREYQTVFNDIIYFPPFYGLPNLKYIEIGENVSAICKNQIEIVVKALPTTMEYTNFERCDDIEVIVSNNPNAPIVGGFDQTVYDNATLFLPNGGELSYKADECWKRFSNVSETPFVPISSITFETEEMLMNINLSKQLHPIINPDNSSLKKLKWSSSNSSVIQVSDDGVISSTSRQGEANITARTCDGSDKKAILHVVVQEEAGVDDITIDSDTCIFIENETIIISGKSDDQRVDVYTLSGQLIKSTFDNSIPVTTRGVYIVSIGSRNYKVII